AMPRVREFVAAFAAKAGLGGEDRARILILVEERLTNLMKYGHAGQVRPRAAEVSLTLDGDRLTLEFADDGEAVNPLTHPIPHLEHPPEGRPIGNLGVHIIRELADEVRYRRVGGRNVVRLVRRVQRHRTT
ncbi:MAG: ATP-binding protein, partial [Alphaproteobacteria bacterium]